MCSGGSHMEVLDTVYLLTQGCHLMEVCGKQGEGSYLLSYVSGKGQNALSTSLFTNTHTLIFYSF